jgi:hypothetical protein
MDYGQLISTMSPDVYQRLVRSVELGKWPDGSTITPQQRENAMQAIIAWGEMHLLVQDRVGYIKKKEKVGESADTSLETPLNWKK